MSEKNTNVQVNATISADLATIIDDYAKSHGVKSQHVVRDCILKCQDELVAGSEEYRARRLAARAALVKAGLADADIDRMLA